MKNVIYSLAFMLIGSIAFANTNSVKVTDEVFSDNIETVEIKTEAVDTDAGCITVNYSCGVSADICNFKGTTKQLIAMVWAQDAAICD